MEMERVDGRLTMGKHFSYFASRGQWHSPLNCPVLVFHLSIIFFVALFASLPLTFSLLHLFDLTVLISHIADENLTLMHLLSLLI